MIVFYADECGDHSMATAPESPGALKSGVSPYFVFATVGIRDSSRSTLANELVEVKAKHFGEDVLDLAWGDSEIKGRYLYRASRSVANGKILSKPAAFGRLDSPEKVSALVHDLGLIFSKYRPLIFAVTVDKVEILKQGQDHQRSPLGVAYAYIHQRIALGLERLYAGDSAIIVADQQADHERFFRSGEMNRVRDDLSQHLYVRPNFDLVLDKPLWVDTDLSSWDREIIQLADIVAYTATETMKRGSAPDELCFLWKQILPCFAIHWSSGEVIGGGLSYYPKKARTPRI
ncbi:DUF3800 domain-containing protein [Demequina activiva]|uniref:DUF3800 domain-containing protein n=1 Tax=Demequina activiva TaxID=1582364 RepID=UPI001942BFB3|nr:DUF3800 domain-containing protein [Demequina activiva]